MVHSARRESCSRLDAEEDDLEKRDQSNLAEPSSLPAIALDQKSNLTKFCRFVEGIVGGGIVSFCKYKEKDKTKPPSIHRLNQDRFLSRTFTTRTQIKLTYETYS